MELKVPSVGESVSQVQVARWLKRPGDSVRKDEPLVELDTDKANQELTSPIDGRLVRIVKSEGEQARVGDVLAHIEEGGSDASDAASPRATAEPMPPSVSPDRPLAPKPPERLPATPATPPPVSAPAPNPAAPSAAAPVPPTAIEPRPSATAAPLIPPTGPDPMGREEELVLMTPIRRKIAQRLVDAQRQAALLTTFNEVDMSRVIELREKYREAFQATTGVKLGFMSFFVKAVIHALRAEPALNAETRGEHIAYRNYYDIGIAVGTDRGLVVPVVRDADRLSFAQIEAAIADFGQRARAGKIRLDELQGGTFTITNGGVFGSLLSTPIVNPPQSGVLGMHAIQDRPVARDGQVVIRPMMYLALTYDHRIVDGREAVTFLKTVKEMVEEPSRLLLEA